MSNLSLYDRRKNIMKSQMELSFDQTAPFHPAIRRQRRLRRARWWFEQMRAVVDRAFDRNGQQAPPPEQIHLTLQTERKAHG